MSLFRTVGQKADVKALYPPLVRAFSFLLRSPDMWFTAAELVEKAGVSRSTVYARFANLKAARAVQVRRRNDFSEFRLHPLWQDSAVARRLHARAVASKLID